ncbi:MAG: SDR family oxidoreductase [Bacteroidales bacterium]|nr:SDR family oxidoreductase [Bacteroidales bacterium]
MDLKIKDQLFIVTGASSGFGKEITIALAKEGARVIAVARRSEILNKMAGDQSTIEPFPGDIMDSATISALKDYVGDRPLKGILVNAAGPPTGSFLETNMEDWDKAYQSILRWKIELTKTFLPQLREQKYGRLVYIESMSTKQPVPNLVLSTSLRLAVTGFVKTLADEVGKMGITANIMAPGYHMTPAVDRVIQKQSEVKGITFHEAKKMIEDDIPVGKAGDPRSFASLAAWLLSPWSEYITGQTISVDGGVIRGIMG